MVQNQREKGKGRSTSRPVTPVVDSGTVADDFSFLELEEEEEGTTLGPTRRNNAQDMEQDSARAIAEETPVSPTGWVSITGTPVAERTAQGPREIQSQERDSEWYRRQLLDSLFLGMKTPAEFLRMCAVIRESLDIPADGGGPSAATEALRAKLVAHLHCTGLEGLAKAAREGDIDRMEGLVLLEHFGYGLAKAYAAVLTMKQAPGESLRDYTRRTVDLWRGIRRVALEDPADLDRELQLPPERAARFWARGITQMDLRGFIEQGIDNQRLTSKNASQLMEISREAEAWLAVREKFAGCPVLRPNPTPAKSKQHQLVAAMMTPSRPENNNGRGQWNPTQQPRPRQRAAGMQRPSDQGAPCKHCSTGTWRRGCDNPLCESKVVACFSCQERSFLPGRGCRTSGCPANKPHQTSGNVRAEDY